MSDYIDSYQTQGLIVLLRYPQNLTAIQQADFLEWLEFQLELAKKRCARMNAPGETTPHPLGDATAVGTVLDPDQTNLRAGNGNSLEHTEDSCKPHMDVAITVSKGE